MKDSGNVSSAVKSLEGVVCPMVTPLAERERLDVPGLSRLVEHILAGGVRGLFVLGSTGEGPSLSHPLRAEVVRRACDLVAGRVPVLVGISDTSFAESLELAEAARRAGAAALVAAPPYYFPLRQEEVIGYFDRLAAAAPLPIMLYNMPYCTKINLEVETVLACSRFANVIGLKDSAGDIDHFRKMVAAFRDRPDFRLFVGPERLLIESVALGGHGGVNGGSNLCPRLYVDAFAAARAGDRDRMAELQARIVRIVETVYTVGRGTSVMQGLKVSLALLGICNDQFAEPFGPYQPEERREVERRLRELGLIE